MTTVKKVISENKTNSNVRKQQTNKEDNTLFACLIVNSNNFLKNVFNLC